MQKKNRLYKSLSISVLVMFTGNALEVNSGIKGLRDWDNVMRVICANRPLAL